ncbi:hypothetical protein [Variovorax atrisoli]|uniref:hypothetical protein n=1 Tax=Variovorax atrisoli TaxID=3394203 RepID=UPI0012FDC1E2|nr:hypothetical protein [Variovorax paradoxus]
MEFSRQKKTISTFKKVEAILDRGASPEETVVADRCSFFNGGSAASRKVERRFSLHGYLLVFAGAAGFFGLSPCVGRTLS